MKKQKRKFLSIGGLFLIIYMMWTLFRIEPVNEVAESAFERLADRTRHTGDYYEVRPDGPSRGGIVLYPDSGEDAVNYAPMAERFALQGLKTRVVKYPLARADLSRTELKELLANDHSIPWITFGFGSGGEKACMLADRSEEITGLIMLGDCGSEINLNDNDIRVSFFELAEEPVAEEKIAKIRKRLPADTVFLNAGSRQELLAEIAPEMIQSGAEGTAVMTMNESALKNNTDRLTAEIERILSRDVTRQKGR